VKIVDPCFVRDSGGIDYPVRLIDAVAYGRIPQKTTDGAHPEYLFYDAAFASSLGKIFLYPEPSSDLDLFFNSWQQLQTFALISTTVALPPGYQRAIEFNLAIELAGGAFQASAEVIKIARESKAAIKGVNLPDTMMRLDPGVVSGGLFGGSILSGP
jgi:hypothetical protein